MRLCLAHWISTRKGSHACSFAASFLRIYSFPLILLVHVQSWVHLLFINPEDSERPSSYSGALAS